MVICHATDGQCVEMLEDDYQQLPIGLVGRHGRCRYDPASKNRLVAACLEPFASVARLALEHRVNANLLCKWKSARKASLSRRPHHRRLSQFSLKALPIGPCCDRSAWLRWIGGDLQWVRGSAHEKGCAFLLSNHGERVTAERRDARMRSCGCFDGGHGSALTRAMTSSSSTKQSRKSFQASGERRASPSICLSSRRSVR